MILYNWIAEEGTGICSKWGKQCLDSKEQYVMERHTIESTWNIKQRVYFPPPTFVLPSSVYAVHFRISQLLNINTYMALI